MLTQQEKDIDRFNLRAGVYPYTRLNPFLYRFDAAAQRAQQAPRTRPMTDQERRTHQAQQGPGRKRVESRVVEPKLLTGSI